MLIMGFDFESTGLPKFSLPSDDPSQPHIVEASAVLVDFETRELVAEYDRIVRPDGWEIPAEMSAIHGITTERALAEGIPESDVVNDILAMWRRAELRVAHNENFDARIFRIGLKRFVGDDIAEEWSGAPKFCTIAGSRYIVALPKNKAPTLAEAFGFFNPGMAMDGQHEALEDTHGCMSVFWGIVDHNGGTIPTTAPKSASKPRTQPPRAARVAAAAITAAADDDGVSFLSR